MFEFGFDQAAGLRAESALASGPSVMPVASPAQPARAYELLCTLAAHLSALGREVVIIDATASETPVRRGNDGAHLGLLHAMHDPSICGLARSGEGVDWLVMPGALGMQALQQTALASGGAVALSRLLAPFGPRALVLLFAPPQGLATLLAGLPARALVPVLPQPQASIDAYGAIKLLHAAGVSPVLAPLEQGLEPEAVPLQQVVDTVADCAQRYLGLPLDTWPLNTWGLRVQESALTRCDPRAGASAGLWQPHFAAPQAGRAATAHTTWS